MKLPKEYSYNWFVNWGKSDLRAFFAFFEDCLNPDKKMDGADVATLCEAAGEIVTPVALAPIAARVATLHPRPMAREGALNALVGYCSHIFDIESFAKENIKTDNSEAIISIYKDMLDTIADYKNDPTSFQFIYPGINDYSEIKSFLKEDE